MEKLWQETENKLPAALAAMDTGTLFARTGYVATIKDTIALHFARSKATRVVHYRVWEQTVAQGASAGSPSGGQRWSSSSISRKGSTPRATRL